MNIATGAMNTLLPKLVELVVGEYKLQKGVKEEIRELEKELTSMDAALHKVSEVPTGQLDRQVKIWASDVRELSYDIEDAVDAFMLRIKGHEHDEPFSFNGLLTRAKNLFKNAKTNHKIHNVIKDIMDQVKKVSERRDRYKVDDVAAKLSTVIVDPRLEYMYTKVTDLVAIEGPMAELAEKLVDESSSSGQRPKIISIVGIGGLGKTSLARALLRDLDSKFDCRVFVSVSRNPDIKTVLKNILGQLDESKYINDAWDLMQLINMVIKFLENKRCLCVIDDVWDGWSWDTIKHAFQDAKHGTRIIITTRNKVVAEHACSDVYELKPLSNDDSRKLFNQRIFGIEDGCPPSLREVSQEILKKCAGVPLAIITTASLLASKSINLVEWEKVNNSIGSGIEKSCDVDKMKDILRLSYNDLPFHLKTCFLYLGLYPEDKEIKRDAMVSSWIAEGFITEEPQSAGITLREIGNSYFSELVNRSLIQPAMCFSSDLDGSVHACQVHDMVLELINQLSAEEGFATMLLLDGRQADPHAFEPQKKTMRRISIHEFNKSYVVREASEQWSKLRSLIIFGKVDSIPPLSSFPVLRVLQLEDCTDLDDNYFNDLGKLRNLRFLRLVNCCRVPESIGKLKFLEILQLAITPRNFKHKLILPMSFVKLQKLVRLVVWENVILPDGMPLGVMKSLQELIGIRINNTELINEIGNLKELRVLHASLREGIVPESIFMCLQNCTNFKELDIIAMKGPLSWSLDSKPAVPYGLQRFRYCGLPMTGFPRWINSSMLPYLTTLQIKLSEALEPQHLEKLAELPSLRFLLLWLWRYPGLQQELIITSGGFRCLKHLHILVSSVVYVFQPGAMPELQKLYLYFAIFCEEIVIPSGLENLQSLRHVIVDDLEQETVLREALKRNPNCPRLELK